MKGRTYRYFDGTVVYPFGYGLSYSTFEYGPVSVEGAAGTADRGIRVTTTIRNTSKRAGEEVAQLYLDPPEFDGAPRLALRGVQRIELRAGEQRKITFELSPRELSFVDRDGARQVFSGEHVVSVGGGQPSTGLPVQSASFVVGQPVKLPH
jgi:beta-glucosidase